MPQHKNTSSTQNGHKLHYNTEHKQTQNGHKLHHNTRTQTVHRTDTSYTTTQNTSSTQNGHKLHHNTRTQAVHRTDSSYTTTQKHKQNIYVSHLVFRLHINKWSRHLKKQELFNKEIISKLNNYRKEDDTC